MELYSLFLQASCVAYCKEMVEFERERLRTPQIRSGIRAGTADDLGAGDSKTIFVLYKWKSKGDK